MTTQTMPTENISIELCATNTQEPKMLTDFGFSRYLYVLDDVKSSLVIAILERNREEALFWAYELYFSGLKADVFCILEQMVSLMYVSLNPRLGKFLEAKKREWDETGAYYIVATFVYNMISSPYDISGFVKMFCKDPDLIKHIDEHLNTVCHSLHDTLKMSDTSSSSQTPVPKQVSKSRIYIVAEQKDAIKYITVNHSKPHYLLRKILKYPVRKNTLAIFDHEHGIYTHEQLQSLYWYNWLYYATASPLWSDRISKYGGEINHERLRIDFPNHEQEEAFYEKYNLEPDEQPKEIQEMNIGTGTEEQLTWTEFYEKYAKYAKYAK